MLLGYGAKVGLGNMRVKAENRMVTYVMLERCLDSDIAEFKRKVCDSPLIKFKVDSVVVLPH